MANETVQPYAGPVLVDLTALTGFLVDLPRGGKQRLRRERPSFDKVEKELAQSIPAHGTTAGIPAAPYDHFVECTERLKQIREAKHLVAKLAEVLDESEAHYEHERETDISHIADAVRSAAHRKNRSLTAHFEETLRYNSEPGEKAVRTRRKNAQAQAEEQGQTHTEAQARAAESR